MKKVTWLLWLIWLLAILAALTCITARLVAQERDTVFITQGYPIKSDTALLRRLTCRADVQLDINEMLFKGLRDEAKKIFLLEQRLVELREYVRLWSAKQPVRKKARKR